MEETALNINIFIQRQWNAVMKLNYTFLFGRLHDETLRWLKPLPCEYFSVMASLLFSNTYFCQSFSSTTTFSPDLIHTYNIYVLYFVIYPTRTSKDVTTTKRPWDNVIIVPVFTCYHRNKNKNITNAFTENIFCSVIFGPKLTRVQGPFYLLSLSLAIFFFNTRKFFVFLFCFLLNHSLLV